MLLNNLAYIQSKPNYYQFLKENSEWIKNLNRSIINIKEYENFIKNKYQLNPTAKISNVLDNIELVANIITTLK